MHFETLADTLGILGKPALAGIVSARRLSDEKRFQSTGVDLVRVHHGFHNGSSWPSILGTNYAR